MTQEQQQQLNFELQTHQNQVQEQFNQRHLEDQQRHHEENERRIQQFRDDNQEARDQINFQREQFQENLENSEQTRHNHDENSAARQPVHNVFSVHPTSTSSQHFQRDHHLNFDSHPRYEFGYTVRDDFSGDVKSQQERRQGDRVEGHYSIIDSDGFRRVVDYKADDVNGFQSNVHRSPVTLFRLVPTFTVHSNEANHHQHQGHSQLANKDGASSSYEHRVSSTN